MCLCVQEAAACSTDSQLLKQIHMYACVYVYTHTDTQEKLHRELPKLIVTFYGCCLMEVLQKMALECPDLNVGYITLDVPSPKLRKQFFVFCVVGQLCNLFVRGCASNSFAFLVISNAMHVPAHLRSSYSQIRSCMYIYIYKYTCIHVYNVHYSVIMVSFLVSNKFVHL